MSKKEELSAVLAAGAAAERSEEERSRAEQLLRQELEVHTSRLREIAGDSGRLRTDEDGDEHPKDPRRRRDECVAADRAHVPLPAEARHEAALAPARERHRVEAVA